MRKGHASVDTSVTHDTGTGAYSGSTGPTTHTNETDVSSTGAVAGPSEPVVYVSEDHEGAPTGAHTGPGVLTYTHGAVTRAVDETAAADKQVKAKVAKSK